MLNRRYERFASRKWGTRAFVSGLLPFVLLSFVLVGCDRPQPSAVVVTNVVDVVREVVVTNSVTVTNVVTARIDPASARTVRQTAPYVVSSSVLSHRQLRDALTAGAARVLTLERTATVEANDRILSALAEKSAGTVSIRPLGAATKVARGAESGGHVIVHPVSQLDLMAVKAAVKQSGGEVVSELPVAGKSALVCKMSRESVGEVASRPDVWLIERYGK